MATTNGLVEIEGLEERIKKLGELSTQNPMMQKRIRDVIRQTLARVRKSLQGEAREGLQMEGDPRNAYKAVRYAVYRKIFGGQVNILSPRNAKKGRLYEPPRKLRPKQRGGNRRTRSDRTLELMSYMGPERGFVLRFLNAGTRVRYNGGRNGRTDAQYDTFISNHNGRGHRGSITARNWFGGASQHQLENAAHHIDKMIDDIIKGIIY
jgi:hypothetical protein